MFGVRAVQLASVRLVLYSTRYVLPEMDCRRGVTEPCGSTIDPIESGGRTATVEVLVTLRLGVPSSQTRTDTVLVVLAEAIPGHQVSRPLVGLIDAPTGACGPSA